MADKIQVALGEAGATLYAEVRAADGTIYNGTTLVTYATANITDYDVPLTQQGTASGYYTADFPATLPAGIYSVLVKRRAGAAPAESDEKLYKDNIIWDGSKIAVTLADVDGMVFMSYMQAILAILFGKATVSGSDVIFKRRDGTTAKVTVTLGATPGERTGSVVA